jgi:hypothetical protein
MKKIALGIIAAAFSSMLLFPAFQGRGQDWQGQDMANDSYSINRNRREFHHDYRELRNDLRRGDLGEAQHEQAEIAQRRYNMERRQEDLNNDWNNRYNGDYGYYNNRYGSGYGYGPYRGDDDD